ncbi:MAG TPA: alpha/beta hydrolase [Ignavibacteriaceae bacterium]|nr:alpha/beta hydrolase [Ignavibacteriaceae bacterium]
MNSVFSQIKYSYPIKFITISDYRIAYIDEGDSRNVLLFIHGLGSYLKAWDRNIPELKKYFRCVAIDLPGYGKSSKQIHSGEISFYTKIIDEIIIKLELKNISLVGHSMGGQIAASYVLDYPNRIYNLILVAPAGFESFNEDEVELIKKIMSPEILIKTSDNQIRLNYKFNFYNMPVEAEEMIADRIAIKKDSDFSNHSTVVSNSLFGLLKAPIINRLNEINIPTLILFGKNDLLIPNKSIHQTTTEEIAIFGSSKIKNSRLILFDKCGHFLQFEKPELFNSNIISFIE